MLSRETREGWLLLTVELETEANGTLEVHMEGILPWLVRWALRDRTIGFYLGLSAQYKIIFSSLHTFSLY